MKKIYPLLFALLLGSLSANAQRNCGTMEHLEYLEQLDPNLRERMEKIENHTRLVITEDVDGVTRNTNLIRIPVVFHVVYRTSAENISDAQVISQLNVLNQDFRRLNSDASQTLSQFLPVAADSEIEFCLATVDPNGNPTNGITRTATTKTSFGTNNSVKFTSQGGRDAWPAGSYLNFWICNIGGGILGYAQFPGGSASTDGVVCDYRYTGTIGTATAPFNKGRTGTHEVGHWLNLRHIWGDGGCSVDDFVSDTPASDSPNYGCNLSTVKCGSLDMVQNYMDYTDDACMNLYTFGQKARMRALFAAGGARASLLNSQGCGSTPTPTCSDGIQNGNETGVDCGGSCPPCPPASGCLTYCQSRGNSTADEFIQSVMIGSYVNNSGNNSGYASFNTTATYQRGSTVNFTLVPGWTGTVYPEYFRIWADWNQNGNFSDTGELVYNQGTASTASSVSGSFIVPAGASLGKTTFRVQMKYNSAPGNCETFSWGEVEDYCVNVVDAPPTCTVPGGLNASGITTSAATLNWSAVTGATSYTVRARQVGQTTWSTATSMGTSLNYTGLTACTNYEFQVSATCGSVSSAYSTSSNFTTTGCVVLTCAQPTGLFASSITASQATLNWSAVSGAASYTVRARAFGATSWSSGTITGTSVNFTGLTACTGYEFQVSTNCTNGVASAYTDSQNFITTGCTTCGPPPVAYVDNITTTSARFNWSAMPSATNYTLRYRQSGTTTWTTVNTTATSIVRTGLLCGTTYQYQIRTRCGSTWSAYSATRNFTTTGCNREMESLTEPMDGVSAFVMKLFPNPAQNQVQVELPAFRDGVGITVQLFDISGKLLLQENLAPNDSAGSFPIDTSRLTNGLYLVHVVHGTDGATQRLVIAR
jgi:hypothetical protein